MGDIRGRCFHLSKDLDRVPWAKNLRRMDHYLCMEPIVAGVREAGNLSHCNGWYGPKKHPSKSTRCMLNPTVLNSLLQNPLTRRQWKILPPGPPKLTPTSSKLA